MLGKYAKKLGKILARMASNPKEDMDLQPSKPTNNISTNKSHRAAYDDFLNEEDSYYKSWWEYKQGKTAQIMDNTIYEKEFFVYGSLQPGNMNWDRLKEETIKAERVKVPGYIRVLRSGFGGFHPNPLLPQSNTADGWDLPVNPPEYSFLPNDETEMAKGWILTLKGTLKFFTMLDQFEGFYPGSRYPGCGSYERRAIWVNERWVWTYPMPRDDNSLQKIDEWTDDTLNMGWRSRSYSQWNYASGATGATGQSNSAGSRGYSYSWEDDDQWTEEDIYSGCYRKPIALGEPKNKDDELTEYSRLLNSDKEYLDRLDREESASPEWALEVRRSMDSEFASLSGETDPRRYLTEEELLKGDSWKDFLNEHLTAPF